MMPFACDSFLLTHCHGFVFSSLQEGGQRSVDGDRLVRRAALSYIPRSLQTAALSQSVWCHCPRSRSVEPACVDDNLPVFLQKFWLTEEAVWATWLWLQKQQNSLTQKILTQNLCFRDCIAFSDVTLLIGRQKSSWIPATFKDLLIGLWRISSHLIIIIIAIWF